MSIQLSNTLTGKKEEFKPLKAGELGIYVCGITPYDEAHIGHARCYVVFDILKRTFLVHGYKVKHIQNFTDVDDKIIDRANKLKADPKTYGEPFIKSFQDSMKALNVLPADQYPRVTTHMKEIVDLIQRIIDKGLAYELEGDVYYSVRKFPAYGKLSKRKLDDLESGARVEVNDKKKDPLDFALWKKAKAGEPSWPSPWSPGRPGWHIECSAMSMKYLGEEFDIHGGGLDLIFPHHENELAQSAGATGKAFAHCWVHNGFVTVNQEKMSKSLGNFFTLKDILAKFEPMVVRYYLLTQHYKGPLNFSDTDMKAVETAWRDRVLGAYRLASSWAEGTQPFEKSALPPAFINALANDLNTPAALAELNEICSQVFKSESANAKTNFMKSARVIMDQMFSVLGLIPTVEENWSDELLALAKEREAARKAKDWKRSDEIRDALKAKGVVVEDTPSGPRLKRI